MSACFFVFLFVCFLARDTKGIDLDGRERGKELGEEEEGETMAEMLYMREE